MQKVKQTALRLAVCGVAGAALMSGLAAPASATISHGTPASASFTADFNSPGLGTGSCTVSYYLGPNDTAAVPSAPLGIGTSVESSVSVGNCVGNGAPDDLFTYDTGNGPGGASCSQNASYIGGFSSGPPASSASCTMTSFSGGYTASDTIDMDNSPNFALDLTNFVPGCADNSSQGVTCSFSPFYENSNT